MANWEQYELESMAARQADEINRLRAALEELMEYCWYASGNGTFEATVSAASLDKARKALSAC